MTVDGPVRSDGYAAHLIWEHSGAVADLYARRARDEAEEMTCAAQAVEILAPLVARGDVLLDVGCGSGHFFHSLRRRRIDVEYWGIDASEMLIAIGRSAFAGLGLPAERLRTIRIEDLDGRVDHVICLNVLTNIDNFHKPLDRLLRMARKSVILRESVKDGAEYRYVRDEFLDSGVDLGVYVNSYDRTELTEFINARGFTVEEIVDRRSGGHPEMVIEYPHWWTFFRAVRKEGTG